MKYILLCIFSLLFTLELSAQAANTKKKEVELDTISLYNGIEVGIDLLAAVWMPVGQPYSNIGVQASVSLKQKYHPLIELGYSIAERSMPSGLNFKMNQGYYARLGLNYKVIGNGNNYFYVGLRYTHSLYSYSFTNTVLTPDYWGGSTPIAIERANGQSGFGSVAAGLHVKISKKVSMGWNVRYEIPIFVTQNSHSIPYIIPGIGIYKGKPTLGVGYSLYYKF